jgi:hypothetical protein
MQRRLLEELQGVLQVRRNIRQQLNEILKSPIDLGVLTDILGFSLPWEPSFRQTLLEETDVDARAAWILEELPSLAPAAASSLPRPGFPPAFSEN